jgi:hypothetical protein
LQKQQEDKLEPSGFTWKPTLFFDNIKWELFKEDKLLGWVESSKYLNGEIFWCAMDNQTNSPIKPMVYRGELSDCAKTLIEILSK